jgi:hypothetical protein
MPERTVSNVAKDGAFGDTRSHSNLRWLKQLFDCRQPEDNIEQPGSRLGCKRDFAFTWENAICTVGSSGGAAESLGSIARKLLNKEAIRFCILFRLWLY